MIRHYLKQTIIQTADLFGVGRFFRYINRRKLLVVMYHGVTTTHYTPPIWTQLPVETFRKQLEFLSSHYLPVSLDDVTSAINQGRQLPERAVLITFDDGLRNNYSSAFPVLKQLSIPAAIFLTVDLIGTSEMLWFDELFFLLKEALSQGITHELDNLKAQKLFQEQQLWGTYQMMVEGLKRSGTAYRNQVMSRLRFAIPFEKAALLKDFGLLSWDEIRQMKQSGLVAFGVHTATHRILSELSDTEWEQEIISPRQALENELHQNISAFCFPNGRPGVDFYEDHFTGLRSAGYCCAFSTENGLFDLTTGNGMSICRVPAGNDDTSDPAYFPLNASGSLHFIKNWRQFSKQPSVGAHP